MFYDLILGFAFFWIVLCGVVISNLQKRYENKFFCGMIKFLSELCLPVLGHFCFISIFSMLMDIFICDNGIGSGLTSSYLNQDCTTFCYMGKHKNYVILATFCITFYLPSAVYSRPL